METWKESALAVRNGRYFVKRGAINWTTHDYETHPHNIALMMDDFPLYAQKPIGAQPGNASMEFCGRFEDENEFKEIEEALLDEYVEDAEKIIDALLNAQYASGDPVVFRVNRETARVVEFHDMSIRVQGIVVNFTVHF